MCIGDIVQWTRKGLIDRVINYRRIPYGANGTVTVSPMYMPGRFPHRIKAFKYP